MRTIARPLASLLLVIGLTDAASAANIQASTEDKGNVIVLEGEIARGDAQRFSEVTLDPSKRTIVILSSPGGSAIDALVIGEMIHEGRYATMVPDDQMCASACGFIWLAGARRFVSETAKIGFHAVYVQSGFVASKSGVGNAMVGAYLTRLGLSYEAVAFVTSAAP